MALDLSSIQFALPTTTRVELRKRAITSLTFVQDVVFFMYTEEDTEEDKEQRGRLEAAVNDLDHALQTSLDRSKMMDCVARIQAGGVYFSVRLPRQRKNPLAGAQKDFLADMILKVTSDVEMYAPTCTEQEAHVFRLFQDFMLSMKRTSTYLAACNPEMIAVRESKQLLLARLARNTRNAHALVQELLVWVLSLPRTTDIKYKLSNLLALVSLLNIGITGFDLFFPSEDFTRIDTTPLVDLIHLVSLL